MDRPKLRKVERIPLQRGDEALLVLRDPLAVAEPFAIDAELAGVLDLLDGSKTTAQIRQALLMGRSGLDVTAGSIAAFVGDLAAAGWLDDDTFRARWAEIHDAFLAAPTRAPTLADVLYPADPGALREHLAAALGPIEASAPSWGLVVPHGPLALTAAILRATLPALPDPRDLDRVIAIGTDHHVGLLPVAACDKDYATPLGIVRCDTDVVEGMRRRMPWIDRESVRHRRAESLEWLTLVLRHAWGDRCPAIVPLVVGSTALGDDGPVAELGEVAAFVEALAEDGRTLVCVAAELTHTGPAYGRAGPDPAARHALAGRDRDMLQAVVTGRTTRAIRLGRELGEHGLPSGLAALALLSEAAPEHAEGRICAYDLAPVAIGPDGPSVGDPAADGPVGWLGLGGARIVRP